MVAYVGGKSRIAESLSHTVLALRGPREVYIEPFVGGGAMFQRLAPAFEVSVASDAMPDLILMWQAIAAGWTPPSTVTESEYETLRHAEPSALRGFVGFQCSFSRKWWGGYGRNVKDDPLSGLAGPASRSIENQRAAFEGASAIVNQDYRQFRTLMGPAVVAYCDPPYADTTDYAKQVGKFDSTTFWAEMRTWASTGAMVLVSEYAAPADWWPVWSQQRSMGMTKDGIRAKVMEKLWMLP